MFCIFESSSLNHLTLVRNYSFSVTEERRWEDSEETLLHGRVEMITLTEQALPRHCCSCKGRARRDRRTGGGYYFDYIQRRDLGCVSVFPAVLHSSDDGMSLKLCYCDSP